MCKIRLQNCKIPKNRSESWSTRCILEASKLFTTSQNFFLKMSTYCFSFTSSVDSNSLRSCSKLNQKNFKILVLIILKMQNDSLIILLQLKSIAQYFPYYHHENMGKKDDILSQNLLVMELGIFSCRKEIHLSTNQGVD